MTRIPKLPSDISAEAMLSQFITYVRTAEAERDRLKAIHVTLRDAVEAGFPAEAANRDLSDPVDLATAIIELLDRLRRWEN